MKQHSQFIDKIWKLAVTWPFLALLATCGAVQVEANQSKVTNENTNVVYTDLQVAINDANPGNILEVEGTFVGNYVISKSLTLNGKHKATLDGNQAGPVLVVEGTGSSINLRHLIIQNGLSENGGGIINLGNAIFLNHVVIRYNIGGGGAGIINEGGLLTLNHCKIHNNTSDEFGGGIANFGECNIYDSSIKYNAAGVGGGILNVEGIINLYHVKIEGNYAQDVGGGLYNATAELNVYNSKIKLNTTGLNGGGLYNIDNGVANFFDSEIEKNLAATPNGGGGVYSAGSIFSATDTKVEKNIPNNITEL